jgi:octaprenyl-diphosphate synthase
MVSHSLLRYRFSPHIAFTDVPGGVRVLNEFALEGGKKFRPQLMLTAAETLGIDEKKIESYAVAVERIHNATLLHDDVIDESPKRRGRATINAKGENKKAILCGDLLLARTLQTLGEEAEPIVMKDLFDVLVDLMEGELLQLEARNRMEVGERHLLEVARKKTGSLMGWSCRVPARLLEASHSDSARSNQLSDRFNQLGVHLGIAFQMADDCLDFSSASGKPFAQDLNEGQVNFVVQALLEAHPEFKTEVEGKMAHPERELSSGFLSEIPGALRCIARRAEIELAAAESLLLSSGLKTKECEPLIEKIIRPFADQLKASLN